MPGQGKDAEAFAAWADQGRTPRDADDALASELEIVALLRAAGPSMDPTADEKARARRRLMARLAADHSAAPSTMETTLPITGGHHSATPRVRSNALSDESAAEITSRIDPIPADDQYADDYGSAAEYDYDEAAASGHVVTGARRSRRAGRHTIPTRPSRSASTKRSTKRSAVKRALLTSSAALLALIAVAGGSMFASRDALPGDSLYGIKRVAESAGTALTFGDADKAARNLDLASTRLAEVQQMVAQPQKTKADPQLVQEAIADFDSSTDAGSSFILAEDETHDPAKLAELRSWAGESAMKLTALKALLPESSQGQVEKSVGLLRKLSAGAAALQRGEGTQAPSGDEDSNGGSAASTSADPTSGTGDESDDPTTDPSDTGAPSTTSGGGLLGGLLGGTPAGSAPSSVTDPTSESDGTSSSSATTTSRAPVSVPLPLPVPINLPPLLPGGRGITIG